MIDFSQMITPEDQLSKEDRITRSNIATKRYAVETQGIVVDNMFINTERDSQGLITGATLSAFMDPTYVCRWKTPVGFVELDAPTLITISQEMRKHVQSCFDREEQLLKALEAGTYTESMLEEGWPSGIYNTAQN